MQLTIAVVSQDSYPTGKLARKELVQDGALEAVK
jgi:hypothetical protein